jgi:K+/H+ antiporter YhaU regulatory subunit KhtT
MYKVTVRHQRLPGIGDRFDLDTASGVTVTVVSRTRGVRDVMVKTPYGDEPIATAVLTEGEAAALAALLLGVQVELVVTAT